MNEGFRFKDKMENSDNELIMKFSLEETAITKEMSNNYKFEKPEEFVVNAISLLYTIHNTDKSISTIYVKLNDKYIPVSIT